ncbi:uncharacterized protein LOC123886142 [Trifolium pratense]|uniref:uncharacterized protein LOC123886142 n=1 Tax=Trifolium pratense TaxID=57577 RepID=UPI001E696CB3|nr:uncharacterized protein LOC123886142 [Trifolium pratense]
MAREDGRNGWLEGEGRELHRSSSGYGAGRIAQGRNTVRLGGVLKEGDGNCSGGIGKEEARIAHGRIKVMINGGDVKMDFYHKEGDAEPVVRDADINGGGFSGSALKRYVFFYFINFPAQMSNFYLRKGFEVCGVLEDVFVAKKRIRYGQPYGFVKFSNVKNVSKLMNALNNVWFGYFRVKASVALFDRNAPELGRNQEKHKDGLEKGDKVQQPKAGKQSSMRHAAPKGSVNGLKTPRQNSNCAGAVVSRAEKEGIDPPEGMQVGDIVIKLGARKEDLVQKADTTKEVARTSFKLEQPVDVVKKRQVLMRSYHSKPDDSKWAINGVVATISNGEAIHVVQNRIMDAGFSDLVLIPMGADKVFVRSSDNIDAKSMINNAKNFFKLVFSSWTTWDKETSPYRRGAWVRLYGVPLHAWNEQFFQLCVFECGGFLRTDSCSAEKNRLDFARVLIATPELDIIKRSVTVLVDGTQVEIKIVEEWGYAMGEDACLFEDESEAESSCGEGQEDPEVLRNVDELVNQFKEGLAEEDLNVSQGKQGEESSDKIEAIPGSKGVGTNSGLRMDPQEVLGTQAGQAEVYSSSGKASDHPFCRPLLSKRTNSCPPEVRRSVLSGPWSLEWLQDQNFGDAGVIFSASKKNRKESPHGSSLKRKVDQDPRRRKAGGVLRHPVHSLKKVARLPSKERCEVLKALKKKVRRRRGGDGLNRSCSMSCHVPSGDTVSSGSVNNDWTNWVAVHGNDQMAVDDVWGIGKAIGVKFKGDNVNMFNILSRVSKGKRAVSGMKAEAGGSRKDNGC